MKLSTRKRPWEKTCDAASDLKTIRNHKTPLKVSVKHRYSEWTYDVQINEKTEEQEREQTSEGSYERLPIAHLAVMSIVQDQYARLECLYPK